MLDKPIPRSKKIGVIGLTVLFALGVFLLPMARADKRVGVAIPEPVSSVDEDVVASDDIAPPEPAAFGGGVFTAVMAPVSGRISGFIYDPANDKVTAEIEMALAEIAKDMTEIEAIKLQIKSMQQQIQMKLDMLQQKEDELAVMFPDRNAKADDYVLTGVETRPPKRSMHSVHVGSAAHQHQPTPTGTTWGRPTIADEPEYTGTVSRTRRRSADPYIEVTPRQPLYNRRADPQKNVSGEVRKELQRILPGLLREILPRLLAEAMAEAVNNAPSQQSMTEPMQDTRLVPPKMPMPPPSMGALPMPVPRPPVPRVKTRADDLVEDPLPGPVNAGEPPAIPRKL